MAVHPSSTIIALDVGEKRIGVATASLAAKLPSPQRIILRDKKTIKTIASMVNDQNAVILVVGLPRGLEGQNTAQTKRVKDFARQLRRTVKVPVYLQDEALTSVQAQAELADKARYNKGAVDALAATYILGDFLTEHREFVSET